MLSLVCRCENNRVFLHRNLEMRPGFLGKWVEFITHEPDLTPEQLLERMLERQQKIKYSEFLEQEIAKGERLMKARQAAMMSKNNRVANDEESRPPKNEEEKNQILTDYQLAMLL
jgi:hypothetical protein